MSVVGAHSVGREWAGLILAIFWARDDPGDPLGRRIPPVLSHLGSVGTVRPLGCSLGGSPPVLSAGAYVPCPRGYLTPPLRSSCQPDGAPGEGCLTEVWLGASGHTRWHKEEVHGGNHHYGKGRQHLRTSPLVVSRGPRDRRCPLVREYRWLSPCRKIRRAVFLGLARSLSWPTRLSGA